MHARDPSVLKDPGGHAPVQLEVTRPWAPPKRPATHREHREEPVPGLYVPKSHRTGVPEVAPGAHVYPGAVTVHVLGHAMASEVPRGLTPNTPEEHNLHVLAPAA